MIVGAALRGRPYVAILTKGWPLRATPTKISQLLVKLKILVLVVVYVVVNESRPVLVGLQLFAGLEANSLA